MYDEHPHFFIPRSCFADIPADSAGGAEAEPAGATAGRSATAAEDATRFQCRHVFTDGHRCGSPALRGENFCYFHHTSRRPIQDAGKRRRRQSRFAVPPPEDRSAIQLSIGQVLQKLANNDLDPRRAGLLLYGLQIASLNLPKTDPRAEPVEPVDQVTQDPEHGPLALPVEYIGPAEKKGSAQLLLEELDEVTRQTAEETYGPALLPPQ